MTLQAVTTYVNPVVRLIPLRGEDVPTAVALLNEAWEWAPRGPMNIDALTVLGAPDARWVTATVGEEIVGIGGVHTINSITRSGELALGVTPPYRRKGVGVILAHRLHDYAFKTLNLHKLTMTTPEGSPASHIARTCKLTLEGRHHHGCFKDGEWLDTLDFALFNPKEV